MGRRWTRAGGLYWVGPDGRTLTIQYVHNEYLQVLAELGTIGLALLLVLLAVVARMVWRGRDLVGAPATWAGVVAGLSALAVHSGLDFLWHLPAIPLTGAVLAGLTARARRLSPGPARGTVLRVSARPIMTDLPSRAPAESQELPARSRLGAGDGPRLDRAPGRPRPARGPSQPVEPGGVRTPAAGIVSVEIDDVEASVRRFIACDPDGKVVNVLSHR